MHTQLDYDEIFKDFTGRDADLRKVTRYSIYKPMFYRTNLYTHSLRTASLVRELTPLAQQIFGKKYDSPKAELMALVHDDAEIYFGDIQAGNKSKMTKDQLEEVRRAELDAVNKISKRFPAKVGDFVYKQLLLEAEDYSSLESQIVCFADKYDALGEALHEIYAGNKSFNTHVNNEYGEIPTPVQYYTKFFKEFTKKFPATKPLFELNHPLLKLYDKTDYSDEVAAGKPHTKQNITEPIDDPRYDTWKKIVLKIENQEVIRDLFVLKEFQK